MSLLLPKSPRIELPRHLAYIRTLPCIFCDAPPPSEAAHFRAGLTGMGTKPHDFYTFPMCFRHHKEQTESKLGELGWWLDQLSARPDLLVKAIRSWAKSQYQDEMVAHE